MAFHFQKAYGREIERHLRQYYQSLSEKDRRRYAAVEAVLSQPDESVRESLAACIADDKEESNRLRVRIAEAFHQRGWSLGDHAAAVEAYPPHGWVVTGGRLNPA